MISITKTFTFEAAHKISNYQGSCRNVHGHSYKLWVTIGAEHLGEDDMVFDFKLLKELVKCKIIDKLDHALILKKNHENMHLFKDFTDKFFYMETEPTAERMVEWMGGQLQPHLPKHVFLAKIVLYETENSLVEMTFPTKTC
jgi:6-pyruvoyltetrahydropterin/6-carboxytetrahydropterin synthase